MLDFGLITAIGLIHLVALVSPGPDFVVSCRNTLMYSRSIGIYTAVGFGLGICVHISYAGFGLSWLISNNELIFTIIKYLGAFYLMSIGFQSLRSFQSQISQETVTVSSRISPFRAIRIGFITNVLNPKATLFFFKLIFDHARPNGWRVDFGRDFSVACGDNYLLVFFGRLIDFTPTLYSSSEAIRKNSTSFFWGLAHWNRLCHSNFLKP